MFEEIQQKAEKFQNDKSKGHRAVYPVFINWIGFMLRKEFHSFYEELNIDDKIFPPLLQLTKAGEAIAISQYALKIC